MCCRRIAMKRIQTYWMFRKKESRKRSTGISLVCIFFVLVKAKRDWLWNLLKISMSGEKTALRKKAGELCWAIHNRLLLGVQKGISREVISKDGLAGLTMRHVPRNFACTAPVTEARQGTRKGLRLLESPQNPDRFIAKWFWTKTLHLNILILSQSPSRSKIPERIFSPETKENHPMQQIVSFQTQPHHRATRYWKLPFVTCTNI